MLHSNYRWFPFNYWVALARCSQVRTPTPQLAFDNGSNWVHWLHLLKWRTEQCCRAQRIELACLQNPGTDQASGIIDDRCRSRAEFGDRSVSMLEGIAYGV